MISSATIEDIIDKIQILSIVSPTWPEDLITNNLKFLWAFCVYRLGILEFSNLEFLAKTKIPKSKIPYRDPPKGLGDDIVGNSRIPSTWIPKTWIP